MSSRNYLSDTDGTEKWAEIKESILISRKIPDDADKWQQIEDKFNKYFSEKPS